MTNDMHANIRCVMQITILLVAFVMKKDVIAAQRKKVVAPFTKGK